MISESMIAEALAGHFYAVAFDGEAYVVIDGARAGGCKTRIRAFTAAEEERLLGLRGKGVSWLAISESMNRTPRMLANRYRQLCEQRGITMRRTVRYSDPGVVEAVHAAVQAGKPREQIMRELNLNAENFRNARVEINRRVKVLASPTLNAKASKDSGIKPDTGAAAELRHT